MVSRSTRQSKILDIVVSNDIETQDELVAELNKYGYRVTQATISRDIKELGLIKALNENNKYKYVMGRASEFKISNKLINVFKEAVIGLTAVNNMLVIRTLEGCGEAIGMVIDRMNPVESLGCISGDDTVLIITKNNEEVTKLTEKLARIIE
ncbi:MAG: arginine repressor [Clostridia bacterium]|nr:arginine repressor [Clostridia bacterium]